MKRRDLNNLLNTDSKEITQKTLASIQSLETIEVLKQFKSTTITQKDSVKSKESFIAAQPFMQNIKQNLKDSHLYNKKHILVNKTKNPYKDSVKNELQTHATSSNTENKKTIYVSIGDINGIGLELILRNHIIISQWCTPIYCVDELILQQAARLLHMEIPNDMYIVPLNMEEIAITPGKICAESGMYSFMSFCQAVELSIEKNTDVVTLPINKYSWQLAKISYTGHTHYLRHRFNKDAIMMLGCEAMFVALYTDHIPLRKVADLVQKDLLLQFFRDFYSAYISLFPTSNATKSVNKKNESQKENIKLETLHEIIPEVVKQNAINAKMAKRLLYDIQNIDNTSKQTLDSVQQNNEVEKQNKKPLKIAVLGLNPHAGDNGVLGHEDLTINECITCINNEIGSEVFVGPFAPDSAFIPNNRNLYKVFIAMYHDSGLAPLKALYFDKSINISLNLPILRTSPDHGTCFDKAYRLNNNINMESYLESFKFILRN